jgi:hypothetical protein
MMPPMKTPITTESKIGAPNTPAFIAKDPWLVPFHAVLQQRADHAAWMEAHLTGGTLPLADFAAAHEYYGLHRRGDEWILRERALRDILGLLGTYLFSFTLERILNLIAE